RVLRALAPAGVVACDEAGRYALTPIGACLTREAPASLRDLVLMVGEDWHEQAWDRLDDAVRSGQNAFEIAHEEAFFEYMDRRPEAAARFDAAMGTFAALTHAAIVDAYDFTDAHVIVDVGGGNGTLLAAILARHPQARGVLLERPHVTDRARATLAQAGLQERVACVAGDFFTAVPDTGDIYILATVLHDWNDEHAISILRGISAAMSPDDRLLIAEQLLPQTNTASFSKLLDIEMLVLSGGRERTAAQYDELLQAAGLRVERVIATPTPTSVIEATLAN
ncbi:MAG TPA: methyltransferase, partial [Solirubrobacteraceae bacterium]|nr:methyltransferase [Solirubrobacteraceae bacterium]